MGAVGHEESCGIRPQWRLSFVSNKKAGLLDTHQKRCRRKVLLCSPTWTRTKDLAVNSRSLYQLSYRGMWLCSALNWYLSSPCQTCISDRFELAAASKIRQLPICEEAKDSDTDHWFQAQMLSDLSVVEIRSTQRCSNRNLPRAGAADLRKTRWTSRSTTQRTRALEHFVQENGLADS